MLSSFWPSKQPANVGNDKAGLLYVSGVDSKSSGSNKTSTLQIFNSDSWSWEILAIAFSLACSIALIILLQQYDSAPVPHFQYGITLNAMISVLATAAKGSFLLAISEALSQHKWLWFRNHERKLADFDTFDSASRGPWGSLNMLVKINFRDIASFGALITVLSLAFDPFMQQVVVYKLRPVHSANATIGRTQNFEDRLEVDDMNVPLKLRAALYNGIFNGDAVRDFTPVCSTGNCTWTPISSLAICSACENVNPNMAVSCNTSVVNGPYIYSKEDLNCSFESLDNLAGFNVSYLYMDGGFYTSNVLAVTSINTAAALSNPQDSSYTTPNNQIAGLRNPWAAFAKATINNNGKLGGALNVTNVTTCAVTPCLKTYNVSVCEGSPISKVVNTWQFETWTSDGSQIHFPRPPVDVVKGTTNTAFTFDLNTALGFNALLQQAFNGTATFPLTDYYNTPKSYSSDIMQALYMIDDLGQMMENVASSLSSHMRTVSPEVVQGKVWEMQTYVHVRWIWLLLPMALMPASLTFLSTAIWISRSRDVGVWKSSSLATLFHGLEDTLDAHDMRRRSNMEETSKTIVARLQLTDDNTQKLVVNANNTKRVPSDVSSTKYKDTPCINPCDSSSQLPASNPGPFRIARRPVGSKQSLTTTAEARTG